MNTHRSLAVWLAAVVFASPSLLRADCTVTNLNMVPLPDLGLGTYKSFTGGLYPDGLNQRPIAHEAAGLNIALNQITPRLLSGSIDTTNGRIVLLSIGVSNTTQEWATRGPGAFKPRADADLSRNPQVTIVDGAQGGQDTQRWTNRNAVTWTNVLNALTTAGVGSNQVQAVWLKHARIQPGLVGAFPVHAQSMQGELEMIARNLKSWFPNVKIAFCSSRTRSYATNATDLNPEPFAYEEGFSYKWMIEKQINGDPMLNYDTNRGPALAPFLCWGPYLWADGLVPRSDGFVWQCNDLTNDFTHPSEAGVTKVADQLLAFFKTDALARPWFLRGGSTNPPATLGVNASTNAGNVPFAVSFTNSSAGTNGPRHYWTFSDGTFSTNPAPVKLFTAPGSYSALATITGTNGSRATGSVAVTANIAFGTWKQKVFTGAELANVLVSGDTADPDFDSISNIVEFALALDPKRSNSLTELPACSIENGYAKCIVARRRFSFSEQKAKLEISTNLIHWNEMPGTVLTNGDVTETLRFDGLLPLSNAPAQFVRFRYFP